MKSKTLSKLLTPLRNTSSQVTKLQLTLNRPLCVDITDHAAWEPKGQKQNDEKQNVCTTEPSKSYRR